MFNYYISKFSLILDPHPPCVIIVSTSLAPICWCNTWTEGEMLDELFDTFPIIKICLTILFIFKHTILIIINIIKSNHQTNMFDGAVGLIARQIIFTFFPKLVNLHKSLNCFPWYRCFKLPAIKIYFFNTGQFSKHIFLLSRCVLHYGPYCIL